MNAGHDRPGFDPLVEFDGAWTTELAERYLPIPGAPPSKYECVDGHLIMSPRENSANSYAAGELYALFRAPARALGYRAYPPVNMEFDQKNWIEPDLAVLREPVKHLTFVPIGLLLMPVELVSPSSRTKDYVDKPARCARAGVPYFMRVEVEYDEVLIDLLKLEGEQYVLLEKGEGGREFSTELPFPMRFDPAVLLES